MPFGLGVGESLIVLVCGIVFWLAPIAAAIWAIATLAKVRSTQDEIARRLRELERRTTPSA